VGEFPFGFLRSLDLKPSDNGRAFDPGLPVTFDLDPAGGGVPVPAGIGEPLHAPSGHPQESLLDGVVVIDAVSLSR
jgi:hypothetical protein